MKSRFDLITEGDNIISAAVVSLMTFGGDTISREMAARLLPMWNRYSELTAYGVTAVLAHFQSTEQTESETNDATGNSGPGWPLGGPS